MQSKIDELKEKISRLYDQVTYLDYRYPAGSPDRETADFFIRHIEENIAQKRAELQQIGGY